MKAILLAVALFLVSTDLVSQELTYGDRLYYTCKVWGFVKYNHSQIANCAVEWNSVLLETLPAVKNAVTHGEFNDALLTMLSKAGPMAIAAGTPPELSPELRRNRNFGWITDPAFRADAGAILNNIATNSGPQRNCRVKPDSTNRSFLLFPNDDPIVDMDFKSSFPDEFSRLRALFSYWNILAVFNPNSHILDTPWDSTLRRNILLIAEASDYDAFYSAFKRFAVALDDAHVEGMTRSSKYWHGTYAPKIVLRQTSNGYAVCKSGISEISVGDLIQSVDGRTVPEWEDSLGNFVSAGNDAVFRRTICYEMLRGAYYSNTVIMYCDGSGAIRTYSGVRNISINSSWYNSYYINDTLASAKWKLWGCKVGYVHMGNLAPDDVDAMIADLRNTSAIIFDVRNYPRGTIRAIADRIFPDSLPAVELLKPESGFPGTFARMTQYFGQAGNRNPYRGRIVILVDEQTQSHGEWTCMILRALPGSVIVGSGTAGADGNVTRIRLTRDIQTGYTSVGVYWPGGENTQRTGIIPDSVVVCTADDVLKHRDPALEKALEIAGRPLTGAGDRIDLRR